MTVIYCATQLTLQPATEAIDSEKTTNKNSKQTLNTKHKLAIGQWTTSHVKQTFVRSIVTTRLTFDTSWYQDLHWYSQFFPFFFSIKPLISPVSGIHIVVVLLWWIFVFHLPKTNTAAQASRNNRQGSHNTIMQAWLLKAPKKTKQTLMAIHETPI